MTDDNDRDRDRDRDPDVGLFGAIRGILEALGDPERTDVDRSGRIPNRHFTTEYSVSGRIGGSESGSISGSQPQSDTGSTRETGDSYLVDIRYDEDDDLLVVADLPDVEADELTVGLDEDRNELVIGVENRPVERVNLPWPVADVESRFRHGVLRLRFTPAEGEG